jgi:XTP/dITP diphosphohydrolase
MNIHFISNNKHKIKEINDILGENINVVGTPIKIDEIQCEDPNKLVRDKILKAFSVIGRPVFVEHTGLYIDSLNELPGGLTQIFWDNLQAEGFINLMRSYDNRKANALTIIGYCDGMKIHIFEGKISGSISLEPKGDRSFQWDCIFIPDGYENTFSELGGVKNEISMRKIALDKFADFILGEKNA